MANEFKIRKGLIVEGASGGTVVDVQGSQGQLFSVTDDLSGSIFAVSDISGVPIFDVNSSGLSTFSGDVGVDGALSSQGTLSVGNGQISLGGTGRIQGVDTVTDNTDAANKLYVDNAVAGVPQGDITGVGAGDGLTGTNLSGPIPTLNVGAGTGMTINADDIAVAAAQTGITSIYNTGLYVGGASGVNHINFGASKIAFTANSTSIGNIHSGGFRPTTTNTMALGTSTQKWSSVYATTFSGDLNGTINTATTGVTQTAGNNSTKIATTAFVTAAIAAAPQGDITAVTAGDYLTGGGTSGNVTLNGDNTKLAHIVDSSNGSVTSGWITVAQASGDRKAGEIYVTDGESSDHSYIRIEWMRSYQDSNFTVLNCGGHANRIQGVRVLEDTSDKTYGKKYLQVKVTATSNYHVIVTAPGTIPNYGDFIAETPVLENSKTGYNVKGNTIEDLQNSSIGSEQGITSGGNIELNDDRVVFTKGDVLSLSAGGSTSGTEIVIDDGGSVIKLNSDTIAKDEFRVSSLTNGNGDDVFVANSATGTFSLGDTQGLGDEAYIIGDASNITILNSGANTLVTNTNNNVEIPNGTLTVSGSTTADSLIKDGGTSSQFLKADGSVDSNTYLTTETGARMVQFNRSGINSSTYTMLATVNGNNLASILKMTMTGTSGNVVFACTFDITVNHSQDIHVKSSNGDYTEVTLRITSNNNEDFSIEAKHNGSTTTTAEVCIYPLADEIITPTTTDPGYTGAEYEHTATEGWRYGGEDNNAESSNVIVDGKIGIGTVGPNYPLVVNGVAASNRFYVPNATATTAWVLQARNSASTADSGLYFENGDAQLLLRDDSNNLNVRLNSDSNSYINGGNLGIGITAPDATLTVSRNSSTYAISRSNVETRAGLSVKSSSNYDSKLNFATGLNSQQYIQGLNNAATTGRPIVLNPYGGYVGINTANLPTQQLDIISGTNNGIRISATDSQTWRDIGIRSYVTEGQANALADHTFIYTTNPSSGTEDPFGKYGATVIQGRDNGNSGFAIRLGNGGGHATRMWMGGTGATTFSNTVTATNFILSSDERLKENIEEVCYNRVKADWKTFELKTEKGQKRYGVIAQELEKTNPEFVREDSQGFKSVAYIDLLIAKIAELEARLEKLEK